MNATIHPFFDEKTNTVSYLIACKKTKQAAILDPVLDYDARDGKTSTTPADVILAFAKTHDYVIKMVLETHVHADHLSSAPYIKLKTGAIVGIGEHIRDVQKIFRPVFNALDVTGTGHEFDRLFKDGETIALGALTIEIIHTPGHTPACIAYKIGDDVFVGDTLFMPDYGTARADFPGGSARELYRSMQKLLSLPPYTRLHLCHDYKAAGRENYAWQTTVEEQKNTNIHLKNGVTEDEFVAMREARDAKLAAPALLMPSIQVNMRAGKMPPADANGVHYIKIPITQPL